MAGGDHVTIKSHIVPASYLARFTDCDGFVHVFDRARGKAYKGKPNRAARRRNYYAVDVEGLSQQAVEAFLCRLEDDAKHTISRVLELRSVTRDSKAYMRLMWFLATMHVRVPSTRRGRDVD